MDSHIVSNIESDPNTETVPYKEPDPIAKLTPFAHPYIKGDAVHQESGCGLPWSLHFWVDCGDHGHTICPENYIDCMRVFEEKLYNEGENNE